MKKAHAKTSHARLPAVVPPQISYIEQFRFDGAWQRSRFGCSGRSHAAQPGLYLGRQPGICDLSCYGNRKVRTENIDRLAAQGARFTQFYVAHVVCSPSRAAMLTGRQPFRSGIVDVLRPDSPIGMPASEITLAQALKARGYATQAVGKWHLGDRREFLPCQHGFDHYFGMPCSMDMLPSMLCRDNDLIDNLTGDKVDTITVRYADEAIQFLETTRGRPFFLYLAHTIPHQPVNLPARLKTPGRSIYYDAIEHMDRETGRVIETIDRLGLRDNTLIVFTSDNGPQAPFAGKEAEMLGLRGGIRDSYEGGLRVPFVANWSGRIPGGRQVSEPCIMYDVFPTFLRRAGGALPRDREYDGQDIWPLLSGQGDFHREKPFVWLYYDNATAIRDVRWKLHVAAREKNLPAPELYDLDIESGEAHNLAAQHPEIVSALRAKLEAVQSQAPKAWSLQYTVRDPRKLPSGVRRT